MTEQGACGAPPQLLELAALPPPAVTFGLTLCGLVALNASLHWYWDAPRLGRAAMWVVLF